MENNRITQQNSSESNSTQPRLSRRRWDSTNSSFLVNLIKSRPWLLWIAVIAFLFTTINLALLSITQTGYVKDEEPKPTTVVTEPEATSSQTDNSVFLWLLGVVILGSGASAIAIALLLPTLSQSQFYQRFQSTSTKAFSRRRQRKLQLQSKQQLSFIPPLTSEEVAPSPTVSVLPRSQEQFVVEERILILLDDQPPIAASEVQLLDESEILPFPENESLNLDPSEENSYAATTESLAEMLDIRKKLPLSTLLGESFYRLEQKK